MAETSMPPTCPLAVPTSLLAVRGALTLGSHRDEPHCRDEPGTLTTRWKKMLFPRVQDAGHSKRILLGLHLKVFF